MEAAYHATTPGLRSSRRPARPSPWRGREQVVPVDGADPADVDDVVPHYLQLDDVTGLAPPEPLVELLPRADSHPVDLDDAIAFLEARASCRAGRREAVHDHPTVHVRRVESEPRPGTAAQDASAGDQL